MSRKKINATAPVEGTTPAGEGSDTSKKHAHAKGCGTLTKRGKFYQARWVVNGKIYVRSTKCTSKRDAEDKLREFTAEYKTKDEKRIVENLSARVQGITAEIARFEDGKPALAVAATWDAYERSTNRPDSGARTLQDYAGQFGRFETWLHEHHPDAIELRNVSKSIADEFAAHVGSSMSPNTFNKYMTLFRCMWEVLKDKARLTINPWASIRRKIQIGHTRRELTVEELKRVCGSLEGEMRLLFAVGIYTGLRLGDCALLEWGNIDTVRGIVSLPRGTRKTMRHTNAKTVIVPIHRPLALMLAEIPKERRTGYVMPGIAELYNRAPSKLSKDIRQVFEDNGIVTRAKRENGARDRVEVGFHSMRHTFVSLCANAGVPLALVQSIVGHTNPAMTLHYFHESPDALKTAIAALPDIDATETASEADQLMQSFREIVGRMDAAQLAEAKKYIREVAK